LYIPRWYYCRLSIWLLFLKRQAKLI
jgi:hypothetical protein